MGPTVVNVEICSWILLLQERLHMKRIMVVVRHFNLWGLLEDNADPESEQ